MAIGLVQRKSQLSKVCRLALPRDLCKRYGKYCPGQTGGRMQFQPQFANPLFMWTRAKPNFTDEGRMRWATGDSRTRSKKPCNCRSHGPLTLRIEMLQQRRPARLVDPVGAQQGNCPVAHLQERSAVIG
jgi:hypothetical protein